MEADSSVPHSVQFHRQLGLATNNGFMSTMMTSMNQVLEWQTNSQELSPNDAHGTTSAHRRIAEAVSKGEEAKAARAMHAHLVEFMEVLDRQGRLDLPVVPRPTASTQGLSAALY
jgi:DNA-binding FadR family transcriptional regulator